HRAWPGSVRWRLGVMPWWRAGAGRGGVGVSGRLAWGRGGGWGPTWCGAVAGGRARLPAWQDHGGWGAFPQRGGRDHGDLATWGGAWHSWLMVRGGARADAGPGDRGDGEPLASYRAKRDFTRTPEPSGAEGSPEAGEPGAAGEPEPGAGERPRRF